MYTLRRFLKCLMIFGIFILGTPQSAWAERKILEKPTLHLERQTETFRIEFEPVTNNFLIKYVQEGKLISVVFEPAIKVDVWVEAEVEFNGRATFTYKYKIFSLKSSLQRIQSLIVEYADAIFNVTSPEGWYIGPLSFKAAINWADVKPGRLGIEPGRSQGEFSFQASSLRSVERYTKAGTSFPGVFYQNGSLPGLVTCYARGYTETLNYPTEPPKGVSDNLPRLLEEAVFGKTVGPVRVPAEFHPKEFLKKIMSYNQESFGQGWIADQQLVNDHEKQFQEVQTALETGNKPLARGKLSSFLLEIEAEMAQKELSPEAYALLKYNAQYLQAKI